MGVTWFHCCLMMMHCVPYTVHLSMELHTKPHILPPMSRHCSCSCSCSWPSPFPCSCLVYVARLSQCLARAQARGPPPLHPSSLSLLSLMRAVRSRLLPSAGEPEGLLWSALAIDFALTSDLRRLLYRYGTLMCVCVFINPPLPHAPSITQRRLIQNHMAGMMEM